MPTIKFSLQDLNNLIQKNLTIDELDKLVEYGKGELKDYDKESDEVQVNFDDTNLPYLWSIEGVARLIKGILGKEKGLPELETKKSNMKIIVNNTVKPIRPYIAAITVKGHEIDDYLLKQIIQFQEKFCDSYGMKRKKVAIGVYSLEKIQFPVFYKTTDPEAIEFEPLGFKRNMTPGEILEMHPTGQKYAHLLKGFKEYPILVDNEHQVLSFPPIINSNYSGKIEIGDSNLFIEATGTDFDAVNLAINIMAQAFYERGFEIHEINIEYPDKTTKCPYKFNEKIKIKSAQIKHLLGLELKETEIKDILEKARYGYNNNTVTIPNYRQDILHWVDIVEDICITYGFNNIPTTELESNTIGETSKLIDFTNNARELMIGYGYQEILNAVLTNKEVLFTKMNIEPFSLLEIKEYMSESYSVVRNWLLPILLETLSKNRHNEYPQKIFEQGIVGLNQKDVSVDYERIAAVTAHNNADFTEIKQIFDSLMHNLGIKEYKIRDIDHDSFIKGRVARVSYKDKDIAYIGEFSPQVLSNWELITPVAGFELNLTELFELL